MEGERDSSSEYIECQCGEFCLLTEFESHVEMHYAEGMGFDETSRTPSGVNAPGSTPYTGKVSSLQMMLPSPTPLHVVTSGPSRPIPIRSVLERTHRSSSRKSGHAIRDFIDVLRHSTSPPSKKSCQAARNKVPRRLGVLGPSNIFCLHIC